MSDGTSGEAGSTKAQPSWKIGEEYTFEVETNQYGTKIKGLKKADSFPSKSYGGGGESPDRQRAIIAQSSVSTAATFYASRGQASEDDVLKFAGRIFNFVMSKVESPQPTPQAPPVQQQPVNNIYQQPQDSSDDLPW